MAVAEVVSGTITETGILNIRPEYATAIPALPPEEHTKPFTARPACVAHACPIPRNLNEPEGWEDSILSQTLPPSFDDNGSDSMRGVSVCRGTLVLTQSCLHPRHNHRTKSRRSRDKRIDHVFPTRHSACCSASSSRRGVTHMSQSALNDPRVFAAQLQMYCDLSLGNLRAPNKNIFEACQDW